MQSGKLDIDGLSIHYREAGNPDGPPILFVHGLTGDSNTWDLVLDPFLADHRVVLMDLRGHGESGWATYVPDGYRTHAFVSDIKSLAEQLDLAPFHLVGHSLGARIGIVYAAEHPGDVRSLALCDTLPEVPRDGALWVREYIGKRTGLRGLRDLGEVEAFVREGNESWQPEWHGHLARTGFRQNWVGKWVMKCDPQLFWITTGSASRVDAPYFWESAEALKCPTLVMWGRTSNLVDQTIVDRMLAAAPTAVDVCFDTGHYIMRERPDEWAKELITFIRESDNREGQG